MGDIANGMASAIALVTDSNMAHSTPLTTYQDHPSIVTASSSYGWTENQQ